MGSKRNAIFVIFFLLLVKWQPDGFRCAHITHQGLWHSHSSPPPAVLSIVGNLLVIIMAVTKSSKMKPPELLCVNLAVTDLGASVTMYPLAMAAAWSHHWIGGDATCVLYGLAGFFFGVASIMNLTLLAVVRFIVSLNLQSPSKKIQV